LCRCGRWVVAGRVHGENPCIGFSYIRFVGVVRGWWQVKFQRIPTSNLSNRNAKSSEYRPKIHRKSINNQPKIDQSRQNVAERPASRVTFLLRNRGLNEKCRALRLGSRLGCVLEASWARLRGQDSSKLVSQIESKSIKNQCKNRSKIRCLPSSSFYNFWWILGRKTEACWHQNRIKNRCQLRKADFAKSVEKHKKFQ